MPDRAAVACESTLGAIKILLVHRNSESELTRVLARQGHDVLTVSAGRRPARFLGVFKPDLVLVVDGAGAETCRDLRRQAPDVPIVAIVPGHAVEQRVAALEAGADDALATPFDRVELGARLQAACRRRAPIRAPLSMVATPTRSDDL